MTSTLPLNVASKAMRDAMRETVKRHSFWYLIQGALLVLAGIVALLYPIFSSEAIIVLLGWLLIISGLSQGISLMSGRHLPHFWPQLISVVLSIVVGFLFVSNPEVGLLTLSLLLIVFFMVEGLSKIIFALTIRPLPNWSWLLASGVLAVLLAIYLWSTPITAAWLIGLLIGVSLVAQGTALAYLAWRLRQPSDSLTPPDEPM